MLSLAIRSVSICHQCSTVFFHLWEKRPAEEPKALTSAVARKQNNAGVDQGEKALLEIVMAGFETLNKSIVSLREKNEPTSEEYQLDDLPDDELADPGEVDADSSEYSRFAKNYEHCGVCVCYNYRYPR